MPARDGKNLSTNKFTGFRSGNVEEFGCGKKTPKADGKKMRTDSKKKKKKSRLNILLLKKANFIINTGKYFKKKKNSSCRQAFPLLLFSKKEFLTDLLLVVL